MQNDYWKARILHQNEVNYKRSADAAERELARLYAASAKEIRLDIIELFDKLDKPIEEVLPNDLYKNNQYFHLLSQMNEKLRILGAEEIKIMEEKLLEMHDITSSLVNNQLGFQVSNADSADILNKIWCPDGKHWSNRIWNNKAIMQNDLETGIMDCIGRGLSKDKIVTMVAENSGNSRYMANRLVRTELTYIQNESAAQTYEKGGVLRYEYLAAADNRVSEKCKSLSGKTYFLTERKIGENYPPSHANCRCTILPIVDN